MNSKTEAKQSMQKLTLPRRAPSPRPSRLQMHQEEQSLGSNSHRKEIIPSILRMSQENSYLRGWSLQAIKFLQLAVTDQNLTT